MSDALQIRPCGAVQARIRPPGSKSITNRALVCAALAEGDSTLGGALVSEDTQMMIESLGRLGLAARTDGSAIRLSGCGGALPVRQAELFVGNSGTTMRFLTAMLAACSGHFRLDGVERMRQRPIGDLLEALQQLGGRAVSEPGNGCPPVLLETNGLRGGTARVHGAISSQFLSGLLLACPYAQQDVTLIVEGELVSQPYVAMTLDVMAAFGIHVPRHDLTRFQISAGQRYRAKSYMIEPDASAASYFWAAAAITQGRVCVEGLTKASLQGDVRFVECLEQMGCTVQYGDRETIVTGSRLRGIQVDMNDISDTAQTLAVVSLFADGPTTIRGVAHIRHKETDRIGDLARELRKLGAGVEELDDGLRIQPGPLRAAAVDTYNDHRMAMSFALAGLRIPGVAIRNPACTAKTYPGFFADLDQVCRPQ